MSYERDAGLRQDLAQDVFLAVLASIDRIDAADNPRAYLHRIAHNVAVSHIAKETRREWVELEHDVCDPGADPAGHAGAADERNRLLRAVHRLRLPYRQVIVLVLEGLEHNEIAEVLGIRSGAVRVRLARAKAKLKELLSDD